MSVYVLCLRTLEFLCKWRTGGFFLIRRTSPINSSKTARQPTNQPTNQTNQQQHWPPQSILQARSQFTSIHIQKHVNDAMDKRKSFPVHIMLPQYTSRLKSSSLILWVCYKLCTYAVCDIVFYYILTWPFSAFEVFMRKYKECTIFSNVQEIAIDGTILRNDRKKHNKEKRVNQENGSII